MQRQRKLIAVLVLVFILGLFSSGFSAEELTITTYYPSPYGSYRDLDVHRRLRRLGDADADGKLTASDEPYIQRFIFGLAPTDIFGDPIPSWVLDVNNDGTVDAGDITAFRNLLYNRQYNYETFFNNDPGENNGAALLVESGNVGIGTPSPRGKLHIVGNVPQLLWENPTAPINNRRWATTIDPIQGYFYLHTYSDDMSSGGIGLIIRRQGITVTETLMRGNVGIGTDNPNSKLEVTGGIGVNRAVAVAIGNIDISGSYLTNGADYAEYFESEGEVVPGYIVGINMATGKARKYSSGDTFIGIATDKSGIIGNNQDNKEGYVLVGLLGQIDFNQEQVVIEGRLVRTADGKKIGVLLSNGKVLIGT